MAFIIVADDIYELREVYKRHLENAGHRVLTVGDGESLLEAARNARPDLILVDLEMPGMDGLEVVRRLKGHPDFQPIHDVPVVLLTGHSLPDQINQGLNAGCDAYIVKPMDPREIVEELSLLLSSGELS